MTQKSTFPALLRRALCAWLGAATLEYLLLPAGLRSLVRLDALKNMSLVRVLLMGAALFLALCLAGRFLHPRTAAQTAAPSGRAAALGRWALPLLFAVYAALALTASFTWGMLGGCALILLLLTVYAFRGWDASPEPVPEPVRARPIWAWLTVLLALGLFAGLSLWGIAQVQTMHLTTYDFGIFSQMFAYMRRTGLPLTTLERDGLLSHFRVHLSPIYYLLLPFYCLVPRPETLNVLQAAVMASAALPLWKLGGLHGLTGPRRFLLCAVLLAAPAIVGGASGGLHENCFLMPLLLWLLWALDRNNRPAIALTALLTLCIKEDAAIYVAVVGLWVLLRAALRPKGWRQLWTGLLLIGVSLAWFILATRWLNSSGDGAMAWRYSNLFYSEERNLLTLVKAVFLCPIKALYECCDAEKLPYIAMTLGVLLGTPLWTRRYERLILLIPLVLLNLLSDYRYQHEILYQYGFGTVPLLIYLSCVNLAELPAIKIEKRFPIRAVALVLAVLLSAGCTGKELGSRWKNVLRSWIVWSDQHAQTREILDRIPAEASVTAYKTFIVPLSDHAVLYDLYYADSEHIFSSDYVVSGPSKREDGGEDGLHDELIEHGFRLIEELPGVLRVYEK